MNWSKIARWTVVGGVAGATVLAGAFVAAFPAQAAELADGISSFGIGRGLVDWWALLAEELGISVAELEQAVEAANTAAVAQLVEEGVITQDQADLRMAGQALRSYIDPQALTAEALGISVDELEEAIAGGAMLAELIEEQGLTRTEYAENLQAARQVAIQQAVDDGVITAEQAEQLQSGGPRLNGDGPGRRHGPGGFGPEGFGPGFGPGAGSGLGPGLPLQNGVES